MKSTYCYLAHLHNEAESFTQDISYKSLFRTHISLLVHLDWRNCTIKWGPLPQLRPEHGSATAPFPLFSGGLCVSGGLFEANHEARKYLPPLFCRPTSRPANASWIFPEDPEVAHQPV